MMLLIPVAISQSRATSYVYVLPVMADGIQPGRIAQSVVRLTQEPEVPGSIPSLATYFCFSCTVLSP